MPYPLVYVVGGADGFGDFGEGAFDEGAEAVRGVFAEDEDVLRTVEVVRGYLRVVRQELLAVEEGFEGAAGQTSLSSLANVDDTAGAGETVEVLGIGELLCRGAGDDEIARQAFGFEAGAKVAEEGGSVFGQSAEEAVGRDAAGLAVGIAEVLACARHSVAFRLARVEARQAVAQGADDF